MTCSVNGCERDVAVMSSGLCSPHYQRFRKYGDAAGKPVKKKCSVIGCDKNTRTKGYCSFHYDRVRRGKDPIGTGPLRSAPNNWIMKHVDYQGDDCLIWPFSRYDTGYGKCELDGCWSAHRYMTKVVYGEPPTPKHQAAHCCHNGHLGCVNPKHLRWATQAENEADKELAGNGNQGANHPLSKLTPIHVAEIVSLKGTMTQRDIARKYDIAFTTVSKIMRGDHWTLRVEE